MTETVTVACKMPHGLILRVFDWQEVQDPLPGGGTKAVKQAIPRTHTVMINGYLDKYDPELPPAARSSAFRLTPGVDKEFFEKWLEQNKDHDAVKNSLIFTTKGKDRGKPREHEKQRCGLEPINRDRLPRGIKPFKKDDQAA